MSVLMRLLQQPTVLQCFRDGSTASGWLKDTECVVQNRVGVLLGRCRLLVVYDQSCGWLPANLQSAVAECCDEYMMSKLC